MIDQAVVEQEMIFRRPCRLCGKPLNRSHMIFVHRVEWENYINSKVDFGYSTQLHVIVRRDDDTGLFD